MMTARSSALARGFLAPRARPPERQRGNRQQHRWRGGFRQPCRQLIFAPAGPGYNYAVSNTLFESASIPNSFCSGAGMKVWRRCQT